MIFYLVYGMAKGVPSCSSFLSWLDDAQIHDSWHRPGVRRVSPGQSVKSNAAGTSVSAG